MEVIDIDKKILSGKKEVEVTNEIIVPDSKEDLVSIISSNGIAYCYKEEFSDESFALSGNADIFINYLSSNGNTRSLQDFLDFNFKIEDQKIKETSFSKYNLEIKEIDVKVLNERKILINAKIAIKYEIYEKQEISFLNEFENIEELQIQKIDEKINSVIGVNVAKASIDEKINIELDKVKEILKADVYITNIENKISYNKVLAKAEANVTIVYLTEDERISSVRDVFPVMTFIEIPNVKEENICKLDFKMRNILLKANNVDENFIETQIDFEVRAEVFEEKNLKIVTDLYSLKNDIEFTKNEIEIEKSRESGEILTVSENVQIDNLGKVFDIDQNFNIKDNVLEVNFVIYYETVEKNGLNIKNITVPVMSKIEAEKDYSFKLKTKEFSCSEKNVSIKIKFELSEEQENLKKIYVINDVKVLETNSKENYSVVIYFVKTSETLWDIAKKFKISKETLMKINNLETDEISSGEKIYVLR